MSLFKILRGNSARISTEITPFHDGYAYFTVDDGGFYIDATNGNNQDRIRVNPKSDGIALTLLPGGWLNGEQTLSVDGLTSDTNGVLGISPNATNEQREAAKTAKLYLSAQNNGSITVKCAGTVPSVNIPISLVVVR